MSPTYDVIIVGAGPVGASMALLCAQYGLKVKLVDKKLIPTQHPAAHVLNGRTLEIWGEIDPALGEAVLNASAAIDPERLPTIGWKTALLGDEISTLEVFSDMEILNRVLSQSAWHSVHLGQHKLEPILWDWLSKTKAIDFQTGQDCISVEENGQGVSVALSNGTSTETLTCRYLISAEGAHAKVRDALGVKMHGEVFAHNASVFFHADLKDYSDSDREILTWIYNKNFVGPLINHYDGNWILMTPYVPSAQDPADFDEDWWAKNIRAALGREDVNISVLSTGVWTMQSRIAERYRQGPVFFVGDAAHSFPPTGGYGLNTGVGDAHNLVWKLAATIRGNASEDLLETYEIERRPIAIANAKQSVDNFKKMDLVTRHVGLAAGGLQQLDKLMSSAPMRWLPKWGRAAIADFLRRGVMGRLAILDKPSPEREALLRIMKPEIEKQREHFGAFGIEFGYSYDTGYVISEDGQKPVIDEGVLEYCPTTWPGARLPYARVLSQGQATTTHRLIEKFSLTLFVLAGQERIWRERIEMVSEFLGMPVDVKPVQFEGQHQEQDWGVFFEVEREGAVLCRPDGHVAWRSKGLASLEECRSILQRLRRVSSGFKSKAI